jgi:hypothetical protein
MREYLEEKFSDLLVILLLFASFGWLFLCENFFPKEIGKIAGPMGYFLIIIVALPAMDLYARERANPYPYLRTIVRPGNEELHLFIKKGVSRRVPGTDNLYYSNLELAFPAGCLDYGRVDRIILYHYGEWGKRIKFRPGWAKYRGMSIKHPQTEKIIVEQKARSSTSVDHGSPIPVFFLRDASQDYFQKFETMPPISINGGMTVQVSRLMDDIARLKAEVAEARRSEHEWHQKALAYEEIIEQQKAEIRGLTEGKTSYKDVAYEFVLSLLEATSDIVQGLKKIRGPRVSLTFNKWMAIVIISIASIAYLYLNPDLTHGIMLWLSSPMNQLFFLILIAIVLGAIYYIQKRR